MAEWKYEQTWRYFENFPCPASLFPSSPLKLQERRPVRWNFSFLLSHLQVSPAEIEDCLYEHQGVLKVGVVGVPHPEPDHHQIPKAFVVPVLLGSLTEQDLKDFVSSEFLAHPIWHSDTYSICFNSSGRLSKECHLEGGVMFLDDIPMSMAGKIQRNVLGSL